MKVRIVIIVASLCCCIKGFSQQNHPIRQLLKGKYDFIDYFKNNVAVVRTHKDTYTLIDTLGNELFTPKFTYIHNTGYDLLEAGNEIKSKMRRGYITKTGETVIPFIYDNVYMHNSNFVIVEKNAKTGLLSVENKIILPLQYEYITDANFNRYIVQQNKAYAFYSTTGKAITKFIFKDAERYYDNVASVVYTNNSCTLIDTNGKQLFVPIPNCIIKKSYNDYSTIQNTTTQKFGLINRNGEFIIPSIYDAIDLLEEVCIVTKNKKTGIIANNGNILTPLIYDDIYKVHKMTNRYYAIKNKLYSLINKDNQPIIPLKYNLISDYLTDYFIVQNEKKHYGIKDKDGNSIIPEAYIFYTRTEDIIFCSINNQSIILNALDTTKNIVLANTIQFKQNEFSSKFIYENPYQIFKQNGLYGVLNDSGTIIIPAMYEGVDKIGRNDLFKVKLNGKFGLINSAGKLVKHIIYDDIFWRKEYLELNTKNKKSEIYSLYGRKE